MLDLDFESAPGADQNDKKKKQKLVKHKRKNWKKTDISEIEEGIEDLRQQELTGFAVLTVSKKKLLFHWLKESFLLKRCPG